MAMYNPVIDAAEMEQCVITATLPYFWKNARNFPPDIGKGDRRLDSVRVCLGIQSVEECLFKALSLLYLSLFVFELIACLVPVV